MKIAVEGCCHGELDRTYDEIARFEARNGYKVDLLVINGDFQALRNIQDANCMAVPRKFRRLGGFHRYYTGEKVAPVLTLLIGGNHEASNYMWELYHGGWLAPNIYFLGFAGCVQVNGIRIAGLSGIYKGNHYQLGHYEKMPYTEDTMRSIYHIREYDVVRLSKLTSPDIVISHDWPEGIAHYGDLNGLLRRKPFFRSDIESGHLGSPPAMQLLKDLKPKWWFSAHLHCKFEATIAHDVALEVGPTLVTNPDEIQIDDFDEVEEQPTKVARAPSSEKESANPDEILLDDELDDVVIGIPSAPQTTRFLALDKCEGRRQFLDVVDLPSIDVSDGTIPIQFSYDPEWLAITRAFHPFLSLDRKQQQLPSQAEAESAIRTEREWMRTNVGDEPKPIEKVQTFCQTAPGPGLEGPDPYAQPPYYTNPQTEAFCAMLQIENRINPAPEVL